jgi:hypothetical protein
VEFCEGQKALSKSSPPHNAPAYIADKLDKLAQKALTRYGENASAEEPFLFAVGDGNHSLASAKGIWEEYKKEHELHGPETFHPCRYALVEIENIYDPAIRFEPIHRVLFGMGFNETLNLLAALPDFSVRTVASRAELARLVAEPVIGNRFGITSAVLAAGLASGSTDGRSINHYALVETSAGGIATACLQPLLDKALSGNPRLSIDYIHGEDELFRIAAGSGAANTGATGILLPPVQKTGFFETVARHGPLPRKSFSMGEAVEKRFYIECRKIN